VPEAPAVIVTQSAELAAVHAQSLPAVTPTDPLPPAAAIDALGAESENWHVGGGCGGVGGGVGDGCGGVGGGGVGSGGSVGGGGGGGAGGGGDGGGGAGSSGPSGAGCSTVNLTPAISTSPARAAPKFSLTSSVTVPCPAPEEPLAILIHGTWLAACQAQPAAAVTVTVMRPPPAAGLPCVGDNVKTHAARCVTSRR
jgi:hypothetical protein